MARQARAQSWANNMARRTTPCQTSYTRRLRFEPLEDRRMLSLIADNFDPTFAQVSRVVGAEATILTVDPSGHFAVFYRPNTELGYINPETGDLLTADYFPGTGSITVVDATVGGNGTVDAGLTNISQLVGLHYSNGQLIATDANTLFHEDGTPLRTGSTWNYASGTTFRSSGIYSYTNSNVMKSGNSYNHLNGITLRNTSGSIFYAANTTFDNNSTGELFYPASVPLRDATGNYFYETGVSSITAMSFTFRAARRWLINLETSTTKTAAPHPSPSLKSTHLRTV